MKGAKAIVGVFTYLDDTLHAIEGAKQRGYEFEVYAPTYIHELEHAVDKSRSPVAAITLTGAVFGLTFGFALAILCGLDWPLRVSAKEIVAVPAYVVIGYECTILFGAIFTLKSLLFFCKIPNIFRRPGYDPRFSHDKFGVVIGCDNQQVDEAQYLLSSAGADEVQVRDGL
jgi:hypothetical protein